MNFLLFFQIYRTYSISFILSNVSKSFWSRIVTDCLELRGKKKTESSLEFAFSTKRENKHFHVVVVQRRQGKLQQSVLHVRSCCFANLILLVFSRSRCGRRHCCLSSLIKTLKTSTLSSSSFSSKFLFIGTAKFRIA